MPSPQNILAADPRTMRKATIHKLRRIIAAESSVAVSLAGVQTDILLRCADLMDECAEGLRSGETTLLEQFEKFVPYTMGIRLYAQMMPTPKAAVNAPQTDELGLMYANMLGNYASVIRSAVQTGTSSRGYLMETMSLLSTFPLEMILKE